MKPQAEPRAEKWPMALNYAHAVVVAQADVNDAPKTKDAIRGHAQSLREIKSHLLSLDAAVEERDNLRLAYLTDATVPETRIRKAERERDAAIVQATRDYAAGFKAGKRDRGSADKARAQIAEAALDEAVRIVEGLITEEVRALPDDQLSDCESAAVRFLAQEKS